MDKHNPITLKFYSMNVYSFSTSTKVEFQSNKGHSVSVDLLQEEREAIIRITEDARARALKEIPEMIAEVIAEERVSQIPAKREQDALELTNQAIVDSPDTEVPF